MGYSQRKGANDIVMSNLGFVVNPSSCVSEAKVR